jgi:hypothetical protein
VKWRSEEREGEADSRRIKERNGGARKGREKQTAEELRSEMEERGKEGRSRQQKN